MEAGLIRRLPNPFDTGDQWLDSKTIQFFAMDANGDGRTDLVEAYIRSDPNQGNLLYFRSYLSKVWRRTK
jgi:hypothetical protein